MRYIYFNLLFFVGVLVPTKNVFALDYNFPKSLHFEGKILDTGTERWRLEEVLKNESELDFKPLEQSNTNLGFTTHFYWVKFKLENNTKSEQLFYLETARPITDVVNLYKIGTDGMEEKMQAGDLIPISERPFYHRKNIFPLRLAPGDKFDFYLELGSDGEVINLPLNLHDSASLIISSYKDQLSFGVFYGILFLAGITYLFFYFGIRQKSFLWYISYVFTVALLHLSLDGYFYQYLTPSVTWFSRHSVLLFAAVSAFSFGRYVQVYVGVNRFSPILDKVFSFFLGTMLVLVLLVFIWAGGLPNFYPGVNAIALLLIILSVAAVFMSHIKKQPVDIFFTLGIVSLTVGFIIFILNNFSFVPNSFLTENITKFSTGLEVVFLSLSMANRIRLLKSEKEKMQEIALQQSEESNQIKSFFLSNISHELRTPLNAIIGLSKSIEDKIKDDKTRKDLEVIQYSSLGLLSSIDSILDYSKMEKKELKLEFKPFDLFKLLEEIQTNMSVRAKDKNLDFNFEKAADLPEVLLGDLSRTRQILNHILDNAIKFTAKGSVTFNVGGQKQEGNIFRLKVSVRDTGVGIKKEKLSRIFASFIQEQIDDKRKFGGFGLGLCIVKELVYQYNGQLDIQSTQGEGTTVHLSIDFLIVEEKRQSKQKITHTDIPQKICNILVVEDNPVNQLVMKSILKKWPSTTFDTAANGLLALEKLKESTFDLILMDLQMPEMDGYEATLAIRKGECGENYVNIPIIAVTADATDKAKNKVFEVGMDDYTTKPIDSDELYTKAKELCQSKFFEAS